MSSLTFVALWCLAAGANDPAETYAQAHEDTLKTGKPMFVMVSTDWCAPCQVMKKSIIPQVRQHGLLSRVAFAVVNPDRDRELATKLIGGGPIPQLLMFRKTHDGWKRQVLVGGQSVETVEQFIKDAVVQDDSKPDGEKPATDDGKKKAEAVSKASSTGDQAEASPGQPQPSSVTKTVSHQDIDADQAE